MKIPYRYTKCKFSFIYIHDNLRRYPKCCIFLLCVYTHKFYVANGFSIPSNERFNVKKYSAELINIFTYVVQIKYWIDY